MTTITIEDLMSEAPRLHAQALSRLSDHHHAEDLVQETLLTAWRKRETFDGRSTLGTWLTGIMKFKILDHHRASTRAPTSNPAETPVNADGWGADPVDRLFDRHGSWKIDPNYGMELLAEAPDTLSNRSEVLAWVRRCMERLPGRLRLLFSMREVDCMTVPEAAAAAGVTAGSAAVLLTRARHQLRACLQHHRITP